LQSVFFHGAEPAGGASPAAPAASSAAAVAAEATNLDMQSKQMEKLHAKVRQEQRRFSWLWVLCSVGSYSLSRGWWCGSKEGAVVWWWVAGTGGVGG